MEENPVLNHTRKLAVSCTRLPGVGLAFDAVDGSTRFGSASLQSDSMLSVDVTKFQVNLALRPRTHYVVPSYAPIISAEEAYPERLPAVEVTNSPLRPALLHCETDAHQGKDVAARPLSPVNVLSTPRNLAPSWAPPASSAECSFTFGFTHLSVTTAAGGVNPNAPTNSPPFRRALFFVHARYSRTTRTCDTSMRELSTVHQLRCQRS
eukprot:6203456-Pleurochrysis_carterae.AAC.1